LIKIKPIPAPEFLMRVFSLVADWLLKRKLIMKKSSRDFRKKRRASLSNLKHQLKSMAPTMEELSMDFLLYGHCVYKFENGKIINLRK